MRQVTIEPNASALIESMRQIGYTLETALADIIDNSITAGARNIELFISPSEGFRIGILDDGVGMTEVELVEAMRPGSRSPIEDRDSEDLGRFGLGLKTASFSQCRRLTVITRRNGKASGATWDLDNVANTNRWVVDLHDEPEAVQWEDRIVGDGTLVIWEKIDRLGDAADPKDRQHAVGRIDEAREHLELVFHRFLSDRGKKRLRIRLNGTDLEPFDPFHETHPATMIAPVERIQLAGREIVVQAYTLPHHQKVSAKEWEHYAGREGYLRSQGFYVYRGRRLILHGTWFRLARQLELTKLARVRIDMPNDLDADWKIDVLKASAQPPRHVRERLRGIIETIGGTSKRVYRSRGERLTTDSRLPVWDRVQNKGTIGYRLNRDHPALADFESRLGAELVRDFRHVLEIAASSLPMDALIADLSGAPLTVQGSKLEADTIRYAVETAVHLLRDAGVPEVELRPMLRHAEPFKSNWSQAEPFIAELVPTEVLDV